MSTRTSIAFSLPLVPVKRRHRSSVVPAKGGGKARVRTFTDARTVAEEEAVALAARVAMGGHPPTGAEVHVVLVHRCDSGRWPDLDNVLKAVKDGCNGVVFDDDRQVVRVVMERRRVPKGSAGIDVRMSWEVEA